VQTGWEVLGFIGYEFLHDNSSETILFFEFNVVTYTHYHYHALIVRSSWNVDSYCNISSLTRQKKSSFVDH